MDLGTLDESEPKQWGSRRTRLLAAGCLVATVLGVGGSVFLVLWIRSGGEPIVEADLIEFVEEFDADTEETSNWQAWSIVTTNMESLGVVLDLSTPLASIEQTTEQLRQVNPFTLSFASATGLFARLPEMLDLEQRARSVWPYTFRLSAFHAVDFRAMSRCQLSDGDRDDLLKKIVDSWPEDLWGHGDLEEAVLVIELLNTLGEGDHVDSLKSSTHDALEDLWIESRGAFAPYSEFEGRIRGSDFFFT